MDASTRSRLWLLAAAALLSTGGAAIKLCALTSWQVAGFRSGVAALTLWVLAPATLRRLSPRALVVGGAYAAMMILFVVSNKLTTAANTIFLQSTAPLYVLLLGPLLLREPIRRRDLLVMAAMAAGLALFFIGEQPAFASAPEPVRGNAIAALGGLAWALTLMGFRWLSRDAGGDMGTALIAGNVLSFLVCLPLALPVTGGTPADWLVVVYLGVFQIALAYRCMSAGVRHVSALEASLLLLLEPVLNPLWAAAVHGERPGPWSLAGGALILAATLAKIAANDGRRMKSSFVRKTGEL